MHKTLTGKVEALCVKDKATRFPKNGLQSIEVTLEGFAGDVHSGFTRPADSRDKGIPRDTPVRNWRQWSAVSVEELQSIAQAMGVEKLDPWWLAANLTFSGIPDFTQLPRGTEMRFQNGTILTVECENAPCTVAGKEVSAAVKTKTPQEFVKAAVHKRGIVGVVYLPGTITVGETVTVILPND